MSRGRLVGISVAVLLVVVLIACGWWRRNQSIGESKRARAQAARLHTRIEQVRVATARARRTAGAIETDARSDEKEADGLTAIAETLADEIRVLERARDDAAVETWLAGGQVSELRRCLDGVTRALNQMSVGDSGSVTTLGRVRTACEAAGA